MGTKANPGSFDCYHAAADDEPMFVLLARDPLAPGLIRQWAAMRKAARGDSPKVGEAENCADSMDEWRSARDAAAEGEA